MVSTNSSPANLLVVGDKPVHPFDQWLERYSVEYASEGTRAIAAIQQSVPDLVLLNSTLNGTGLQICSTLKDDESLGYIPVIVLLTIESDRTESAYESGADEVLVEPVEKAELLTRINSLLRIKRRFDALKQQNRALSAELDRKSVV